MLSPLVWGAWIETSTKSHDKVRECRPSYGGRGLKHTVLVILLPVLGRPSYGGRGLKPEMKEQEELKDAVAPRMGGVD